MKSRSEEGVVSGGDGETTSWGEHRVRRGSVESLCHTSERNRTSSINHSGIERKERGGANYRKEKHFFQGWVTGTWDPVGSDCVGICLGRNEQMIPALHWKSQGGNWCFRSCRRSLIPGSEEGAQIRAACVLDFKRSPSNHYREKGIKT